MIHGCSLLANTSLLAFPFLLLDFSTQTIFRWCLASSSSRTGNGLSHSHLLLLLIPRPSLSHFGLNACFTIESSVATVVIVVSRTSAVVVVCDNASLLLCSSMRRHHGILGSFGRHFGLPHIIFGSIVVVISLGVVHTSIASRGRRFGGSQRVVGGRRRRGSWLVVVLLSSLDRRRTARGTRRDGSKIRSRDNGRRWMHGSLMAAVVWSSNETSFLSSWTILALQLVVLVVGDGNANTNHASIIRIHTIILKVLADIASKRSHRVRIHAAID